MYFFLFFLVPTKLLRGMVDRLGTKLIDVPSKYCSCFALPSSSWSVSSIELSLASPLNSGSMIIVRPLCIGIVLLLTSGDSGGDRFVFFGSQNGSSLSSFESEHSIQYFRQWQSVRSWHFSWVQWLFQHPSCLDGYHPLQNNVVQSCCHIDPLLQPCHQKRSCSSVV